MAVAGVLATALTDHSARSDALWVGGVDVIKDPAQRYGVPIESIQLTENGPGGVSTLSFTVEDYQLALAISQGMEVRFQDLARDAPRFLGWVDAPVTTRVDFGDQGRAFDVTCIGVESVLDWAILSRDLTFAAGSIVLISAIQSIVAAAVGLGPIRAFSLSTTNNGTQAFPVAGASLNSLVPNIDALTLTAGTSVREALRQLCSAMDFVTSAIDSIQVTVDFTYGLRVWPTPSGLIAEPDDYGIDTITDTPAGATAAERLSYRLSGAPVRGVWVKGAGVAAAFVSDGSGIPGRIEYLEDATLLTATACQAAGVALLRGFSSTLSGTYSQSDRVPNYLIRGGAETSITDARVGLTGQSFQVASIDKTFNDSGRENWAVTFGGLPPSAAALIRRLTRTARA